MNTTSRIHPVTTPAIEDFHADSRGRGHGDTAGNGRRRDQATRIQRNGLRDER